MSRTADAKSEIEDWEELTDAEYQAIRRQAERECWREARMRWAIEIVEIEWSCGLALQLMKKAAKKGGAKC
jgi:hypothetical protein